MNGRLALRVWRIGILLCILVLVLFIVVGIDGSDVLSPEEISPSTITPTPQIETPIPTAPPTETPEPSPSPMPTTAPVMPTEIPESTSNPDLNPLPMIEAEWQQTSPETYLEAKNQNPPLTPEEWDAWTNRFNEEIKPLLEPYPPFIPPRVEGNPVEYDKQGHESMGLSGLVKDDGIIFAHVTQIVLYEPFYQKPNGEPGEMIALSNVVSRLIFSFDNGTSWAEFVPPGELMLVYLEYRKKHGWITDERDASLVLHTQWTLAIVVSEKQVKFYIMLRGNSLWHTTIERPPQSNLEKVFYF